MTMNTSRMIELALVFLVSLLSFSIGTFVGKKYSDNQHRLSQLEPKSEHAVTAEASHDKEGSSVIEGDRQTAVAAHGAAITDSDVAKLAEEFASEEDAADSNSAHEATTAEHKAPAKPETAAAANKTAQAPTKIKDVKEITHDEANNEQSRDIASISPSAKTTTQFTVQVGAYPSPADAEKITSSLKARGYKASYVSAVVNGKTYYRVHVGTFDNFQEAQEYKKELMEQNRLTSAIIQKIQK